MGKKVTKSVKNSGVKRPAKIGANGGKKLYEAYERGYFVLKAGEVWKKIV